MKLKASCRARAGILSSCISAVLVLPHVAIAQDAAEGEHLGEIVVTSASGIATSVQDAPASITVIDAAQIQAQGARDVRDVLRKVPGLNLTQGNNGVPGVSFRGLSSSRTLMLVDGKRLSSKGTMARHYQGDYNTVPLDRIERIEVVRGPMSTLYGSDAMGGVINVITKPNAPEWSGSITTDLTYGDKPTTADSQGISAYVSGPLGQRLTLSAWAKHHKQDTPKAEPMRNADGSISTTTTTKDNKTTTTINYREGTSGSKTNTLGGRLEWAATDTQTWGVELSHTAEDYLGGTDSAVSNDLTKDALSIDHKWALENGELATYLRFEDSEQTPVSSPDKVNSFKTETVESRYTTLSALAGRELELTFGGLLMREKLYDPTVNGSRNPTVVEGSATSGALYGEARWHFNDALTITGGLRYDNHEEFGGHLTPRLYANYALNDNMTLKAGYAQAFVAPDLRSLSPDYLMTSNGNGCKPYAGPCRIYGNPDLKPETSDNFELGLNYQGESLSWEVTAFYNDVKDMIGARRTGDAYTTTIDGQSVTGYYFERINLDEGKTAGIEAGFSWDVSDDVTWYGTATYLAKSEFKYAGFDTPFPMATTPKWNVSTGTDYRANDKLTLSANATYVGKQAGYILAEDLSGSTAPGLDPSVPAGQNAKAYVLVDVAAAYDLTESTKLNVGVSNLFDQQPEGTVSYMEDGRAFKLSLSTRF